MQFLTTPHFFAIVHKQTHKDTHTLPHTPRATIRVISKHLQHDRACFFSLLHSSSSCSLSFVDQWGSSWASTINQSLSAICLLSQPITALRQLVHEKCGLVDETEVGEFVGGGCWRCSGVLEERREVEEHSVWFKSGHSCTTALYTQTVDSQHDDDHHTHKRVHSVCVIDRIFWFKWHILLLIHIYIKLKHFSLMFPLLSLGSKNLTETTMNIVFMASLQHKSSRTITLLICCPIMSSVLTPQSFISALSSLFCIITMLALIYSHLIAMIRLHLMLLHCSHLSLLFTPPLSLIMDFLQILLVCDADQVSHFGFMNSQTSLL